MKKLEDEAKKQGIVMINECGVDPGTDHMSAMKVINEVYKNSGKIISFTSYCGGLPEPKDNNNPFGYKLSWAPRGVLLASKNSAHFLKDGKDVTIKGEILFDNYDIHHFDELDLDFEGYPNRDSKQYIDIYGIKDTKTIIRGTFRNKGWCQTIKKISDLGLLSTEKEDLNGMTYKDLLSKLIGTKENNLKEVVSEKLSLDSNSEIISRLDWLGLFSDKKIPSGINTALDALCHLCQEKLIYKEGERDMLLMRHTFIVEYYDRFETVTSTLIDYGIKNGDTSMSRTVTLPVAIAVRLVAEGKFNKKGLQIPVIPELYNPILEELETFGIKFVEKVIKIEKK